MTHFSLSRRRIQPDDRLEALRRRIAGLSRIGVIEDICVVRAEPLCDPLIVRPPFVHKTAD